MSVEWSVLFVYHLCMYMFDLALPVVCRFCTAITLFGRMLFSGPVLGEPCLRARPSKAVSVRGKHKL